MAYTPNSGRQLAQGSMQHWLSATPAERQAECRHRKLKYSKDLDVSFVAKMLSGGATYGCLYTKIAQRFEEAPVPMLKAGANVFTAGPGSAGSGSTWVIYAKDGRMPPLTAATKLYRVHDVNLDEGLESEACRMLETLTVSCQGDDSTANEEEEESSFDGNMPSKIEELRAHLVNNIASYRSNDYWDDAMAYLRVARRAYEIK